MRLSCNCAWQRIIFNSLGYPAGIPASSRHGFRAAVAGVTYAASPTGRRNEDQVEKRWKAIISRRLG